MKPQKLRNSLLLLSAGVFIGASSFAQSPRQTTHSLNPHGLLARITKSLPTSNIPLYQPIQAQTLQQKPTATKSRLMAIVPSSYDGVFFIPEDSIRLYWNGTRAGNGDAIVPYFLSVMTPFPPSLSFSQALYEPNQEIEIIPDPDSVATYDWDNGPGVYEVESKSLISLDASGNVVSIINQDYNGTSWENDSKNVFTYDAQGNRLSEVDQDWSGTVWDNSDKTTYTYNANNDLTEYEELDWNAITSDWESDNKSTYEYDGQGNFTRETYQTSVAGILVNSNRYSYTYANGKRVSEITEDWNAITSQWENDSKEDYTYDNNGQIKTILGWNWSGGSWKESTKNILTYDASGKNTSIIAQQWDGSSWQYVMELSYAYSGDNLTEMIMAQWDNSNNSFEKQVRIAYTYNNYNQCTSLTGQDQWDGTEWSASAGSPKFSFYYEEYDDGGEGIHTALGKDDFQLYPNPAKDQLTVKMNGQSINHIRIVDISGKEVFSSKGSLNTSEATLPVGQLANGIYLLQLQSGQQQGTRTFVIQH